MVGAGRDVYGRRRPHRLPETYVRANTFADFLETLDVSWFAGGEVQSSGAYRPPGIGFVSRPVDIRFAGTGTPWPTNLPPLLSTESANEAVRFFCEPVASQVRDYVAQHPPPAVFAGRMYAPGVRPLLPEELAEHGCAP